MSYPLKTTGWAASELRDRIKYGKAIPLNDVAALLDDLDTLLAILADIRQQLKGLPESKLDGEHGLAAATMRAADAYSYIVDHHPGLFEKPLSAWARLRAEAEGLGVPGIFGKWPGDETDEQVNASVASLDGKPDRELLDAARAVVKAANANYSEDWPDALGPLLPRLEKAIAPTPEANQ